MESHGGIILAGENKNSREKPVPVPFFHHKSSMD
jgi:hypothetical protein